MFQKVKSDYIIPAETRRSRQAHSCMRSKLVYKNTADLHEIWEKSRARY